MNEVEIRGKISSGRSKELKLTLEKDGKLLKNYHRLSVDLSPGFDEKTRMWNSTSNLDLRIKKSDNEEKISLRVGDFHKKERPEIDVRLVAGEFLNAVMFLDSLGYNKGFEIKLSEYSKDYSTWEIESKNSNDPNLLATALNLVPYSREDYKSSIEWENQNLHKLYSKELVLVLLRKFD